MDTNDVRSAARQAGDHPAIEHAARLGYAVNGVMHLVIAWLGLQLALGTGGEAADQSGALQALATTTLGRLVLWLAVVGFLGLGLWQLTESVLRYQKVSDRLKSVAKALVYLFLAVSSFSYARGNGGASGQSQSVDFTVALMAKPAGRFLVVAVGLGIVGVGIFHLRKGWRRTFLEDLRRHPGPVVQRAGRFGYVAKGVALGLVGILFVVAGVREAPDRATGLDGALRTLLEAPYGRVLLAAVALGFAAYGAYSFARARYAKV